MRRGPLHSARQGHLDEPGRQGYLVMEIADSARKHGVRDKDIDHAVRNPVRVVAGEGRDLVIGADRAGRLGQIVISTMTRTRSQS